MDALGQLLETWGYTLLVLLGFVEFIGLPIASVPVLVLAGAVAAGGGLSLPLVVLSAAAGGLAADLTWYGMTRWRGPRLLDTVCNLTSNPRVCVFRVTERIESIGPIYILPSKFLPGTGNLIAACSGLARISPRIFALSDTVALLLWATMYSLLGYLFSVEVLGLVEWITGFTSVAAAGAVLLILGAAGWRFVRARLHEEMHAVAKAAGGVAGADPLHGISDRSHDSVTITRPRTA
jgi:membrane protein DedA with SNARE-associated domain